MSHHVVTAIATKGSPWATMSSVLGIPTLRYSINPNLYHGLARSVTMRLATLPTRVRLPAIVESHDSWSHAIFAASPSKLHGIK